MQRAVVHTFLPRALLAAMGAFLALYAFLVVIDYDGAGSTPIFNWIFHGVLVGSALACFARGVAPGRERTPWLLLGVAIALWTAGDLYWTYLLADQDAFPSTADWLWLAFYPFAYAGIGLLIRTRVSHNPFNVWLDGAIAALTVASIAAAVVFETVLSVTSGDRMAVAVNLAYPLADMVLLALVIAAIALSGWRLRGTWAFAAAGCAAFAITDSVYLYQVSLGTYETDTLLDVGWPAACFLLAVAAWQPARRAGRRPEGWWNVTVPIGFASLAIGVLVYDHFVRVTMLALVLATAACAVVLLRLALTFRDNVRLLVASREEALTDGITGLGNRRALLLHLEAALADHAEEKRLVLVLLDLNGFKEYNDSFGHLAGDALLARLGGRLAAGLPDSGHAFRMGGDEFCASVRVTAEEAPLIAARAGAALADRGDGFAIDSAYGHVVAPDEAATPTEILKLADQRMYASKASRASVGRQSARVLLRALQQREGELSGATDQLVALAEGVGRRLGLDADRLERVRRATELHDVGNMAVPDAILLKQGALNESEWDFIRRHTITGEWILSGAPALARVAPIVRSSHERWDGSGYPDSLEGEDIPFESRIVAACDAYMAMVNERPYRAALSHEHAVAELLAGSGTQFDPAVVDALVTELWERIERDDADVVVAIA